MANVSIQNQTIALAALHQASSLVQQLAVQGNANHDDLETSIGSILKIDSDSVIDIYGSLPNLRTGFQKLRQQLSGRQAIDPELVRYTTSLVFLESKLADEPAMQKQVAAGIEKVIALNETRPVLHEDILASLAELYQATISMFQPRVIIKGDENFLRERDNTNKIRALLLAGIRAALLWRQCGGSRWKFIFQRKKILEACDQLLRNG